MSDSSIHSELTGATEPGRDHADPGPREPAEPPVSTLAVPAGPLHDAGRYESARRSGPAATLRRWVLLTKPRIIELLLVTTVPAMVIAADGWPGTWLVLATLLGGTLCAGSANAINNVLDRDVDALMSRTRGRPSAREEIAPRPALAFAVALGVGGFAWLAAFVNLTAALLATGAILYYVFVYTLWLKRRTSQAVVVGGVAGCVPVLTGWAAVPGASFADPRPWLLFALVFWWTPPHFWALAMKYRDDYARAGLPMLPVTHGNDEATRQILLHSYLLLSIVLLYIAGAQAGWLFIAAGLALTGVWLVLAHRLRRERTVRRAMHLFHYSTSYLALLFVAAAVDPLVVGSAV